MCDRRNQEELQQEDLIRADGDMKVSEEVYHSLEIPGCPHCTVCFAIVGSSVDYTLV